MKMRLAALAAAIFLAPLCAPQAIAQEVRVKELGRFLGWRDNALVGYGIVTGLSGSGDSPRSAVTRQSLANVLSRLGVNIPVDQLQSRNVAVVMVTATLPPASNIGDRLDVSVTSAGDARSLAGGTLLMTPLLGPDKQSYALAQGALLVGGYQFQDGFNLRQKNYPTSGVVPSGATVEASVNVALLDANRRMTFVLKNPDFTTAERIAQSVNQAIGAGRAIVRGADAVVIDASDTGLMLNSLVSLVENVKVVPDQLDRIVISERSGTIVAGGDTKISSVVIAQGDIKIAVSVEREASLTSRFGGYVPEVSSLIVTNRALDVTDNSSDAVVHLPATTVADLAHALFRAKVSTRNMIAILQAIKTAGALHADIIVQ